MKKSLLSKSVGFLLVLAILLSVTACGTPAQNNTGTTPTPTASNTNEDSVDVAQPQGTDPLGKYDPPITVKMTKMTFSQDVWPEGDSVDDNIYTRQVAEELGINVEYIWTSSTDYYDKLNLTIASGDLPDIIPLNTTQFASLVSSGDLEDITDVYEEYASDIVKGYCNAFPVGFDSAKSNGRLMAMPILGAGAVADLHVMWIRDDWLQKSGKSAPTTMEETFDLARTFMEQNPGSQGIALANLEGSVIANFEPIANAYHAYPHAWIRDKDNNIVYGSIQPEMKTFLQVMQNLYAEGIIDKEFSVKDTNKVVEDIVDGRVGITFGVQWMSHWPFPDAIKQDANAIWKPYLIPSTDDKQVMYQSAWPINRMFAVRKGFEHPEALIKMMNLHAKNTDEGRFSTVVEFDWQNFPTYITDPDGDYKNYKAMVQAQETGDTSHLTADQLGRYEIIMDWIENKTPSSYGTFGQISNVGSQAVLEPIVLNNFIMLSAIRGAIPEGYAAISSTLEKIEAESCTRIVLGESIDIFDNFVEQWNSVGGAAATEEINAIYK